MGHWLVGWITQSFAFLEGRSGQTAEMERFAQVDDDE
jgi:hypothetical protein